jgi:hypothetical protein
MLLIQHELVAIRRPLPSKNVPTFLVTGDAAPRPEPELVTGDAAPQPEPEQTSATSEVRQGKIIFAMGKHPASPKKKKW